MAGLPVGTVTFLFSDIEGSTRLLQYLGDRYAEVLSEYRTFLRAHIQERNGREVDSQGDACVAAFPRARDAVAAAVAAQRAVAAHQWPDGVSVQVRMGLHTGEPMNTASGYVGMDLHRAARICSAGHGGQILLSQTTHDLVERDLPANVRLRDLGEHRLKDLQRSEKIFQVVHPALSAEFPLLRTLDIVSHNLPVQVTSFIGREREIAEIKRRLATMRLLTLTGAGGAGKTRLALQAAAEMLEAFADGVWLADLAPLLDPSIVPRAVASVLGVREEPGRTMMELLVDSVRPRSLLLVLDNCEHLVAASAHLVDTLMRACPSIRIIATSRQPLGLTGEMIYRVPSLSLPDPHHPPSPEDLFRYEALRLFVERALLIHPETTVTERNARALVQVCHRLDGIPLAIELAAARLRVLSIEQIEARLDDRFRLLTGGGRTVLPRHQTLRAVMEWSYALLSEKERVLFRWLSVFAGGWTLEAAEGICVGDGMRASDILDLLTQLVDKSLVVVETRREQARYRLLETVRQYSLDRLVEAGEVAEIRRRHREWHMGLAERADSELRGPGQAAWLDVLEAEHDNFRAALEWSKTDPGGAEAGLRLAGALHWFWYVRGYLSEGREWMEGALARGNEASASAQANALKGAGVLAWRLGEYRQARELLQQSVTLFQQVGDIRGVAFGLHHLGHVSDSEGDYAQATILFEKSLAFYREVGDKWGLAVSSRCLGDTMYHLGDYSRAMRLFEDSLALIREVGDNWILANVLSSLGLLAGVQGDYKRANALLEEALHILRLTGDKWGIALAQDKLANVSLRQGDIRRAAALYAECLVLRREVGAKSGIADYLEGLAKAAAMLEQPKRAARLFGAADAVREVISRQAVPAGPAKHDPYVAATRKMLGQKVFVEQWAEGRAMPLERAIEEALAPMEVPPATGVDKETARKHIRLLTQREREVAALIARGLTNRDIAALLVITERTAETHVLHILNKLGFNSRAQIAAWAGAHGLHTESPDDK